MEAERDRKIRERAYELWEAGGRREGEADAHWRQASEEIGAGGSASTAAKPAKVAKPAAAKSPATRSATAESSPASSATGAGAPARPASARSTGPRKAASPGAKA